MSITRCCFQLQQAFQEAMASQGVRPNCGLTEVVWVWEPTPTNRSKGSFSTTSWRIKLYALNIVSSMHRHSEDYTNPRELAKKFASVMAHEWRHFQQCTLRGALPMVDDDNYNYNGSKSGWDSYYQDPGEKDAREFSDFVADKIDTELMDEFGKHLYNKIKEMVNAARDRA